MKAKPLPNYYAAVVVIDLDGRVLLGKRKEDGIWTTPAGGSNLGEESPAKTASRELFEEAGIPCESMLLKPLMSRVTRNGKTCHVYLHVVPTGTMTTSKLDPDQEVKTWKWFSRDEIPDALRNDMRRWDSVMAGYMSFYGINKSLIESLEKGGKPAEIGEVRNFGGKDFKKIANGEWAPVVHPEEKQLKQEQDKKVVSLTSKLKQKIEDKNQISHGEKHLHDLKNQVILEGKETRSGKPMFTKLEAALSHGYEAQDFREVANVFYDRAQSMADNIAKLQAGKQQVDPNFEKIKKENMKIFRSFLGQALRIESRQKVTKSVVALGHQDAAEINTADFSQEHKHSLESEWLERFTSIMDGYTYGEEPRMIMLSQGDLYLVKVDHGIYSGVFKKMTQTFDGDLLDNAKVRLERMTLPTLVQFCIAKEWISTFENFGETSVNQAQIKDLTVKLSEPQPSVPPPSAMPSPVESNLDKLLRLIEKLTN